MPPPADTEPTVPRPAAHAPLPLAVRRWPLTVLVLLLPFLSIGIFGRCPWRPDEPRETAIAARMARPGGDWAVPHLGTKAFCEKPPLYYWVAGLSQRLFGPGTLPVRAPNLLYALASALLVGALAASASGRMAALAAGVFMGTAFLACRVEIWSATDAPLLCAVAGALLGCFRGLQAERGRKKLAWYALLHFCLGAGFLSKGLVACLVPVLAWIAFVAWERRWREGIAWELVVGMILPAVLVAPWAIAVAGGPDGAAMLRAFFLDNQVGRFIPLAGVPYTRWHQGWAGKYLVELPAYLLPWTFLAAAAAAAAWRAAASTAGDGPARRRRDGWRFALCAILPPLVLLSVSSTMRNIYAVVLMPGCALLVGLWAERAAAAPGRFDRAMGWATIALVGVVAAGVPAAAAVAYRQLLSPTDWELLAFIGVGVVGLAGIAWRTARAGRWPAAMGWCAVTLVAAGVGAAPALLPAVNRSQDLAPVSRRAVEMSATRPLLLWQPDETLIGTLDADAGLTPRQFDTFEDVTRRAAAEPATVVLTEVSPEGSGWRAQTLLASGWVVDGRIDNPGPGGRHYALFVRGKTPGP